MEERISSSKSLGLMRLVAAKGPSTLDPLQNLLRESFLADTAEVPSFRVWRSTDSIVLGRSLVAEDEVRLEQAEECGTPVLRRTSGGGAVFHDLGNVNYSIYLPIGTFPELSVEESLRSLSFPVTELLGSLGVDWTWEPPNNVYVRGAKISGSAQARSRGHLLHHGTLLVSTDLEKMRRLLQPGGRSRTAPVINLSEVVPAVTPQGVSAALVGILEGREVIFGRSACLAHVDRT